MVATFHLLLSCSSFPLALLLIITLLLDPCSAFTARKTIIAGGGFRSSELYDSYTNDTPETPHTHSNIHKNMKATVYIALTLDGYIATSDGSVDFLNHYQSSASKEDGDMGFSTFLNSVDLLIMGRKTWDQVISFGEEVWPYGDRKVWIWSREGSEEVHIPEVRRGQAEVVCMGPTEILKKAENEGFGHAYVDGGTTISGVFTA